MPCCRCNVVLPILAEDGLESVWKCILMPCGRAMQASQMNMFEELCRTPATIRSMCWQASITQPAFSPATMFTLHRRLCWRLPPQLNLLFHVNKHRKPLQFLAVPCCLNQDASFSTTLATRGLSLWSRMLAGSIITSVGQCTHTNSGRSGSMNVSTPNCSSRVVEQEWGNYA